MSPNQPRQIQNSLPHLIVLFKPFCIPMSLCFYGIHYLQWILLLLFPFYPAFPSAWRGAAFIISPYWVSVPLFMQTWTPISVILKPKPLDHHPLPTVCVPSSLCIDVVCSAKSWIKSAGLRNHINFSEQNPMAVASAVISIIVAKQFSCFPSFSSPILAFK